VLKSFSRCGCFAVAEAIVKVVDTPFDKRGAIVLNASTATSEGMPTGTSLGEGGALLDDVRRRRVPIVGRGNGVWSFVHIDDAAAATLAAIERRAPGVYNIVDDEPAPVSKWLPVLAAAVGAKPPRHIPAFLARVAIGEHGVALMTQIRGASNAKAKRELGWRPRYPTWRTGFREALGLEGT
jgi:nucleoside-diphosphate-sugar epimerase